MIGFPNDPENVDLTLQSLRPYFLPKYNEEYLKAPPGIQRQTMRDLIVMNRMRAYDLEFELFEKRLNGDANAINAGGDLLLLTLTGLTATAGGVATKAALGAASTGIAGGRAVINKDLYFQKTLPALLAQMEANRNKAKSAILDGLNLDDTKYPLVRAELDLDTLKRAGGIPSSIEQITSKAAADKEKTQKDVDKLRDTSFNTTGTTTRMMSWLFPKGMQDASGKALPNDPIALAALQAWMKADGDPVLQNIPPITLLLSNDPGMEETRLRAAPAARRSGRSSAGRATPTTRSISSAWATPCSCRRGSATASPAGRTWKTPAPAASATTRRAMRRRRGRASR